MKALPLVSTLQNLTVCTLLFNLKNLTFRTSLRRTYTEDGSEVFSFASPYAAGFGAQLVTILRRTHLAHLRDVSYNCGGAEVQASTLA